MTWVDVSKIAGKIIDVLANNKVMPSEWKYAIPMYIAQAPLPVVINAKNLADGINEAIEKYHPDFPQDKICVIEYSEDWMLNE